MTQWYIGIDETGSFNHLDPNDNSNVSAAITKKSPKELFDIFKEVAQEFGFNTKGSKQDKNSVLKHFHGCEQKKKLQILDKLLNKDSELVDCVIQSKGRPFITVNPQQWWIAAVIGVVQKFFTIGKCQKEDKVHIEIALRDDRSLGLRFIPQKEVFEQYNAQIAACIQKELKQNLKGRCQSLKVSLQAAGHSELPTLGDQVSNMIKPDYQAHVKEIFNKTIQKRITPYTTAPFNASLGNDVENHIEKGNLQGATEILLSEVLNGFNDQVHLLAEIIEKAREPEASQIWQTIINSCSTALWNRGKDGNVINRVSEIINRLWSHYKDIPSDHLKNKFFHLYADYMGCAGKWDNKLFSEIENSFNSNDSCFSNPLKRWNFYLNIFSAKAQTYFNVYKFGELEDDYKRVHDVQKQIDALKFPFEKDSDPDQNYCEIYGTIAQDLAFQEKYSEAIKHLEKVFEKAPVLQKSKYASFLSVAYFKQKDFKKAKEWHVTQCNYTEDQNDQWIVLEKLRVSALAMDQGEKFTPPPINEWHNDGDYPWPLLLKWSAYLEYKKGNGIALKRLEQAYEKLRKSPGFTIRTLALSVIAMQIFIVQDGSNETTDKLDLYRKKYKELLEKCKQDNPSFATYVQSHPLFEKVIQKAETLWEAANLLPFNFA